MSTETLEKIDSKHTEIKREIELEKTKLEGSKDHES